MTHTLKAWLLAAVAVAVPSLVLLGIAWAKAPFRLRTAAGLLPDVGAAAFQQSCARCHSLNGQPGIGPTLENIGVEGAKRRPGTSAARYILESILEPAAFQAPGATGAMPRVGDHIEDVTLRSLVYYLASQGAEPDAGEILSLPLDRGQRVPPPPPVRERVERGEAIFRDKGRCLDCHDRLSAHGPPLEGIGLMGADYLREALCEPDKTLPAAYRQTAVALKDGRVLTGRLLQRTPSEIVLLTTGTGSAAKRHRIPLADVETGPDGQPEIQTLAHSLMPSYKDTLTPAELDDLLHFLGTLR